VLSSSIVVGIAIGSLHCDTFEVVRSACRVGAGDTYRSMG
jgi:hypothetical protein